MLSPDGRIWCHVISFRTWWRHQSVMGVRLLEIFTLGDFIWYQSSYNSNQSESNLRHLNFDPYPSRTRGGPWVTLVATHATMRMSLIFKCPIISIVSELSGFWGVSTIKWNSYRQFGGHKNRENKSSKIEFNFVIVCFGLFWVFIHVRLTIQRIRIFALLDKKLCIYLMQNFRSFTYLMIRGVQRILEELLSTPVRSGIKYL